MSGSRALPPRWLPQCSCGVIESSFDPGERLQAPGSLWFVMFKLCTNKNHSYRQNEQINSQNIDNSECFGVKFVKIYPEMTSQ